ncbi:hypothetical protein ACJX0J_000398, partial [Zea mays]
KAYKVNQIWRWRLKLQWIYEKIFLIKKEIFFLPILRFLFEEPLPFFLNPFFLISVENFKYGELHLLSKLLQVASVGQSTLTRFYSLHTFVVTCHLDTSLQLRSIFIQISLYTPILLAKLAKGMGHNYYGEPAGTSFPYFKYSYPFLENVNKFQNPFLALWLGIGATLPIDKSLTLGLF